MLKKTVQYEDFNGDMVKEDIYFNLTKAELVEMEINEEGGMAAMLERVAKSKDGKLIMATFKNILLSAYGVKSDDGRKFQKTQEIRDEFASSLAYDAIFFELVTNDESAAEFVNGLAPKNLREDVEKASASKPKLEALPVEKPTESAMTREQLEAQLAAMKAKQESEKQPDTENE